MKCIDHGSPQPDCIGCLGHWDRAAVQRVLAEYLIYGIARASIRGALAEVDRLTASLLCHDLDAFADGELTDARAAAFRDHLARCPACEAALLGRIQEHAVVSVSLARRDAVVDAAVAWVRAGGTLAALAAAVNAMEDANG